MSLMQTAEARGPAVGPTRRLRHAAWPADLVMVHDEKCPLPVLAAAASSADEGPLTMAIACVLGAALDPPNADWPVEPHVWCHYCGAFARRAADGERAEAHRTRDRRESR